MIGMSTRSALGTGTALIGALAARGAPWRPTGGHDDQHRGISAPALSPVDFAGLPATRRGKALPAGYVVVGRHVSTARGAEVGYPAMDTITGRM